MHVKATKLEQSFCTNTSKMDCTQRKPPCLNLHVRPHGCASEHHLAAQHLLIKCGGAIGSPPVLFELVGSFLALGAHVGSQFTAIQSAWLLKSALKVHPWVLSKAASWLRGFACVPVPPVFRLSFIPPPAALSLLALLHSCLLLASCMLNL